MDEPAPAEGEPGARQPGPGRGRFRAQAMRHNLRVENFGPVFDDRQSAPDRLSARESLRISVGELKKRLLRRGKPIPVCLQTQESDCGPAALTMTLRHRGVNVRLEDIRTLVNAGPNGASARTLLDVARGHGVPGRGIRTGLDGLSRLTQGAILFWNFRHFVVLEAVGRNHVDIVDPAFGRRRLTRASAGESFTGIALEFDSPMQSPAPPAGPVHREPSPWRHLWQFRPRGRTLGFLIGTSVLLLGFELALPLTTAYFVDDVLPARVPGQLPLLSAGLAVLSLLFALLQIARSFLVVRQQGYLEKRLTIGVMDHMLSLPYHYFQVRNSGDLALRVRASTVLNFIVSITSVAAAFDSIMIFLYTGLIIAADPALASIVIALVLAELAVLTFGWRRQVRLGPEVLELQTQTQDELMQILTTINTLKSEGVEGKSGERWSHLLVREVNKRLSARRSLSRSTALSSLLQFGAPLLVLCAGTWRVFAGHLSEGNLLGFTALTVVLFVPLSSMFNTVLQLATIRPTVARVDDIVRSEPEPRGTRACSAVGEPGRIVADGVCFSYPGGGSATALSDVSLSVSPGQFVAIVGRSGSGKSTLAMLLAGLYPPDKGTITVDGADLRDLDRVAYRRQIGYIQQDARLYHGSIRDNILFGADDAEPAQLRRAVELARVEAEIAALPMGYDTLVSSTGVGLSGGQRQRIVLARALAKQPRLLILDEATSALDPAMEEEIFRDLIGTGLTLIVVAHRLTVINDADQVLVLSGGKVVEAGLPADLGPMAGEIACLR